MFNAIGAVGSRLKSEVLFILSAALLLSILAYQNHLAFLAGAAILFVSKIHLDMSEAVMVEATAHNK